MKTKRIKNQSILKDIRSKSCLACNSSQNVQAAHVISRGAGGHDSYTNVIPLCYKHHKLQHDMGFIALCDRFPTVLKWFEENNLEDFINKKQDKLKISK